MEAKMPTYKKYLYATKAQVLSEITLQRRAAKLGFAPDIIDTDCKTYITMDLIDDLSIADKYGDSIRKVPLDIREQILDILWILYSDAEIEYVDVTGYNFIEKDGKVWIIDFGHARKAGDEMDPFLVKIFNSWKLSWNPKFK
jgi:tRNA A-37 threonylcarbamoyl transferase component Bud32